MNQTLDEAPETRRVKKSSHHPRPQRRFFARPSLPRIANLLAKTVV